jgi:dTDP-4-dehydrorhamnose reductase
MDNKKIKICILGANGQLGETYQALSKDYPLIEFKFYDRKAADICDLEQIKEVFSDYPPDYVINCAAYTAVDRAEAEPEITAAINNTGCLYLSEALKGKNTKIIHFSSDYVYHSYDGFPLREVDLTKPHGVYAQTKLDGENALLSGPVPTLILRTSWVISPFGHNFVKTMIKLGQERQQISVVNDQYGTPTLSHDLVAATLSIITIFENEQRSLIEWNSVYNYSSEGCVTWYEMACLIMEESNLSCKVIPINTTDYPTPAQRPRWSVMSKHKIKEHFGLVVPHWRTSLVHCLNLIKSSQS